MVRRAAWTLLAFVALLASAPAFGQTTADVSMVNFAFDPPVVTILVGDSVRWTNNGAPFQHSATADDGTFDSGLFAPGGSFTFTFTSTGTWPYYCILHGAPGGGGMSGQVVVLGPATPTPTPTATATPSATATPTATATVGPTPTPLSVKLELNHGYRQTRSFVLPGGTSHVFRISQKPYSSYEVVVDSTSGDVWPGLTLQLLAPDGVTVLKDSASLGAQGFSRSLRFVNATGGVVQDQVVRASTTSCPVPGCGPEDTYRVRVYDTTAVVPRFNNSATQITLLVLQNTTGGLLSGAAHFWTSSGTLVGSQAFGLAAHQTLTLNTSAIPGVAGQGGTITIAHDGRYGELGGKAVAVEPATGFSFDTSLTTRPR